MKPSIGILLEFGFHEIKKYIHSGFAKSLAKHFNICWFAVDKGNKEFDEYFSSVGHKLIYIPKESISKKTVKIEAHNQAIRRVWMDKKGVGRTHNYKLIAQKGGWKNKVIGTDLLKSIVEKLTLYNNKKKYYNLFFQNQYEKYKITNVLFTSYTSTYVKSFVVTAQKKNIKTWYLVNSWKDLYINNFLPFKKLSGIFTWSKEMSRAYLYNMPYLSSTPFHISGNPTFDALLGRVPTYSRTYYAEKYKIPVNAKWAYYTMMPPGIQSEEIEVVRLVAKELLRNWTANELVILLRRNPIHEKNDFEDVALPQNVVLTEHHFYFDASKDMLVQSNIGEKEWLDLLQYSSLNLSVPSTVTLEFLTLGKPVVNIEFDSNGKKNQQLGQFFEAGYYKPLFENNKVIKCSSINELTQKTHQAIDQFDFSANKPSITPSLYKSSEKIISQIIRQ